MNKIKIVILTTILSTIIVAIASLLLPVAPDWPSSWELYHLRVVIALLIPSLNVIAALFFLLGLQTFREELRKAYSLIALGIISFGLCLLFSPAVTLLNLWDTWIMTYGVPNLPFLIPIVIITRAISLFFSALTMAIIYDPQVRYK